MRLHTHVHTHGYTHTYVHTQAHRHRPHLHTAMGNIFSEEDNGVETMSHFELAFGQDPTRQLL